MAEIGKLPRIVIVSSEARKFVAFDLGSEIINGHQYRIVSPYLGDMKRRHWLEMDAPVEEVRDAV